MFCNSQLWVEFRENLQKTGVLTMMFMLQLCGTTSFNTLVFFSFAGTLCFCGLFHSAQPDLLPHEGQLHSGNEWAPRTQYSLLHTRERNAYCRRGNQQVDPESYQCYGGGACPGSVSVSVSVSVSISVSVCLSSI